MAMTQNDANFERDLSDAFAPVKMSAGLQQRLLQLPQLHPQRPASWLSRLLPRRWLDGLAMVSARPAFGMTTGVAAACCSLVIGLSLGLGGFAPVPSTQGTVIASNAGSVTTAVTTGTSESDAVSLVYAAADLPGDLP
jgi:hypothetical protein